MTERREWWKTWDTLAVAAAVLIFVVQAVWLWDFSIDDAGVSWRYAAHLADGHGLRWNLEGAPVEGYSNFLWVLMLGALGWVGLEIESAAKVLGLVFALGTFALLGVICRQIWKRERFWWTPLLLLALSPLFAMWAMSGLELASVAAFVLLAIFSISESDRISRPILSLASCGLILSRPEGVAVALLLLGAWVVLPSPGSDWRQRLRIMSWPLLWTLVTAIALSVFRLWYFGYLMPNTVHAKFSFGLPSWQRVLEWLLFVTPFLVATAVALKRIVDPGMRKLFAVSLVVVLGHTAMILPVSSVMNFEHRYHMPYLSLLLLGVPSLLQMTWAWRKVVGVALLVFLVLWPLQGSPGARQQLAWEQQRIVSQRCIAEQLGTLPGKPTVALQDAGRIPYWRELQYIDAWGLCDVEFARNEYSPLELLKRRPNVYVMSADSIILGYARPRLGMDGLMYSVVGFAEQYRLWKHCVLRPRRRDEAYHYAILIDVFWANKMGVAIPSAARESPRR